MQKIINSLFCQLKAFMRRHAKCELSYWMNLRYRGSNINKVIMSATPETYTKLRRYPEAEHQIGRFLNMKQIINEVEQDSVPGDLVEFGTWQGQGLILFDLCAEGKIRRKLIGIDSFEGLPETSTIWKKETFNDTSYKYVSERLHSAVKNFESVQLIQGWFDDPHVSENLYKLVDKVSIVHLDADLGSSTRTALKLIEHYMNDRHEPMYLLFDDWGCHPNEVPDAFHDWLSASRVKYNFKETVISTTNLTRYYRLDFGN